MLEEGVFFEEAEWSLGALGGISSHCMPSRRVWSVTDLTPSALDAGFSLRIYSSLRLHNNLPFIFSPLILSGRRACHATVCLGKARVQTTYGS